MKTVAILATLSWASLWLTPDQQGQRAFDKGDFKAAAERFNDPMRQGVALYRAGEFKQAQAIFSRLDSAEAHYNRGNCLVFLGQYKDAIASYDRALTRRPEWKEASDNRALAEARAKLMEMKGGDMGDQKLGADKIVFDKKKPGGQETQMEGDKASSNSSTQALWLRRVQTSPADFLKSKFAYQEQFGEEQK
ncbi:tetratricopeptide repeat protein [Haloferula chungangensis]|uniref:Tetratricopeptide repeat protein n=1 Tax=Haloferula chungangensis TaxID=1048331 RepID=A0ABW2L8P9_9BACT